MHEETPLDNSSEDIVRLPTRLPLSLHEDGYTYGEMTDCPNHSFLRNAE